MEILLYGAIGYGIGKLYINNVKIVKNQHYTMIKHHIKMFKMNIKTDMMYRNHRSGCCNHLPVSEIGKKRQCHEYFKVHFNKPEGLMNMQSGK